MLIRQLKFILMVSAIAGSFTTTSGQSNDALLNKLVSKGILTQQEADELKEEADAGFDKAYRTRAGLPEWVTSVKFYGDVRGRFDGIYIDNDAHNSPNRDRNRMRYRVRVGAAATFKDNLEMGFRFTSGEAQGGFGGDPISGNSSFQDNGSKKSLWVDLAYGKWTPVKNDTWQLSGTIGKIENPFVFSPIVFDDDYTPEGIGLSSSYKVSEDHSLKFAGGFFWLDEISQGSESDHDPFLLGIQARWDAKWTPKLESSAGLGFLAITDERSLTNFSVPNLNVGNTRMPDGTLAEEFTPVLFDASLTYLFEPFAGYQTRFPLKFGGLVIHNPGASDDNTGYELGVTAGKAGRKGMWELSYRWRYVEHDAWYEELLDSDFAAFYQAGVPNAGIGAGYRAGTNLRGHIFRASYSPADAFNLSISYYLTEAIDGSVVGGRETDSSAGRLLVDAMWKF
jgi:hypothetical protein